MEGMLRNSPRPASVSPRASFQTHNPLVFSVSFFSMLPDKIDDVEEENFDDHIRLLANLATSTTLNPKEICAVPVGFPGNLYHSVVEVFRDVPKPTACYGTIAVPVKFMTDENGRPCVSYIDMIREALYTAEGNKLKLTEIYAWIMEKHPYYKTSSLSWKNSVRHALSVSKEFRRICGQKPSWSRGGEWELVRRNNEAELVEANSLASCCLPSFHISKAIVDSEFEMSLRYEQLQRSPEILIESKSPLSDPFAIIQEEALSQDLENIPPSNTNDMPELPEAGNMKELMVTESGIFKRRSLG